jgi:SM-20-related protein
MLALQNVTPASQEDLILKVLTELEHRGFAYVEDLWPADVVLGLLDTFKIQLENENFDEAAVGADWRLKTDRTIRHSNTCWIEDWKRNSVLSHIEENLNSLMVRLNEYFFLSLKRFESQLAFYPVGGFYKKHLDQIKGRNHRQVSMVFYLNDCLEGGELVLYERDDKLKKAGVFKPRKGRCVIFFSSQIYHEVLPTRSPRFSLTTWFRDDI